MTRAGIGTREIGVGHINSSTSAESRIADPMREVLKRPLRPNCRQKAAGQVNRNYKWLNRVCDESRCATNWQAVASIWPGPWIGQEALLHRPVFGFGAETSAPRHNVSISSWP